MPRTVDMPKKLMELIGAVEELPTLPDIVLRISRMTVSPQTNAADIGRLISNDPALSSRVLRLVNSAYYGFPRKIASVTKAIVLLGFNKVKNMAISASVADLFSGAVTEGFSFKQYWHHAVAAAIAGELLAKRLAPQRADDAFVGGLLSEIGKVMVVSLAPDIYAQVLREARTESNDLRSAETRALGSDFCANGAMLAETWQFPDSLVRVIRHFRDPDQCREDRPLLDLVHVASALAWALGHPGAAETLVPTLRGSAFRNLKVTESLLAEVGAEFMRQWALAGALLEMAQ
ncbi:MAG TPA: HDOD domain-containing protein [Planctomycetota bacterium]|nr:HDOD domain-containing protein [Planctomycetota bacterium]